MSFNNHRANTAKVGWKEVLGLFIIALLLASSASNLFAQDFKDAEPFPFGMITAEGITTPSFADIDNDNDLDAFMGFDTNGRI